MPLSHQILVFPTPKANHGSRAPESWNRMQRTCSVNHKTYFPTSYCLFPFVEQELDQQLSKMSWTIADSNLDLDSSFSFALGKHIPCSSAEHVVFHCSVSDQRHSYPFVVKFKKIKEKIHYLSRNHAQSMVQNYRTVDDLLHERPIPGLQVSGFALLCWKELFKMGPRFGCG